MNLELIHDLALVLPPGAARHYRLLKDANADSAAVGYGFSTRLLEENERRRVAWTRLSQIKGQRGVDADHPEVVNQTLIVTDADAEIERINLRAAQHNQIAGPRAELLRNCEAWIRNTAVSHSIVDIEVVEPPKLLKGETTATAIERVRRRLRELDADANRVTSAPYPSATAKAVAADYINQLAEAAAPIVSSTVEHGGPLVIDGKVIEPPVLFASKLAEFKVSTAAGPGVATGEQVDTVGLLCWLFKDQMLARIGEAIDAEADDAAALTHEQRAEKLAVIKRDREHAELFEAHYLWASFREGVIVEPRASMSPAAFLMVGTVKADRRPGRDHADGIAAARAALEGAAQRAGPGDIHIPGMT